MAAMLRKLLVGGGKRVPDLDDLKVKRRIFASSAQTRGSSQHQQRS